MCRVRSGVKKDREDADPENHQDQQHEDFGNIQEEKGYGVPQVGAGGDGEHLIGYPRGKGHEPAVKRPPGHEPQRQQHELEDFPEGQFDGRRFYLGNRPGRLVHIPARRFESCRLLLRQLIIHG